MLDMTHNWFSFYWNKVTGPKEHRIDSEPTLQPKPLTGLLGLRHLQNHLLLRIEGESKGMARMPWAQT